MNLIYLLLRASKWVVGLATVVGVISGAANSMLIVIIHRAINNGSPTRQAMWTYVACCVVVLTSKVTSEVLLMHLGQGAVLELRLRISRRILSAPLGQLEKIGPHRLMAALADDVLVITNSLIYLPILCINVAVLAGCLIYLGTFSWLVLGGVTVFMIIGILSYQIPDARARQYLRLARNQRDMLFKHFRALIEGIKELKLHSDRRDAFLSDHLRSTAVSYSRYSLDGTRIYIAAAAIGQMILFVVIGLVLFVLPSWREFDPQTLTGYTLTILYMMAPLQVILSAFPTLARASVALSRIQELGLSLAEEPGDKSPTARPRAAQWSLIEMVAITHVYYREREDDSFILGPIDLAFYPGEIVFLIGGNGSGKTTLIKLLTSLYNPESGCIQLDGQPVTEDNMEHYRQMFSSVFSDYYLFETLLGLASPALDENARQYLIQLHLDHKVKIENGVLSTIALSQGQRKRLALLTAYMEDRPFYIFDEWAADQDPLFKELFYTHLLSELKARGKTVLVISHDDKYYSVADRIIKLNYGKLEYDSRAEIPHCNEAEVSLPVA
jgi:putative ATP-binding cassette transporter